MYYELMIDYICIFNDTVTLAESSSNKNVDELFDSCLCIETGRCTLYPIQCCNLKQGFKIRFLQTNFYI